MAKLNWQNEPEDDGSWFWRNEPKVFGGRTRAKGSITFRDGTIVRESTSCVVAISWPLRYSWIYRGGFREHDALGFGPLPEATA